MPPSPRSYATDETPELMPLTHVLATQIGYKLTEVRFEGGLRGDPGGLGALGCATQVGYKLAEVRPGC